MGFIQQILVGSDVSLLLSYVDNKSFQTNNMIEIKDQLSDELIPIALKTPRHFRTTSILESPPGKVGDSQRRWGGAKS